jgi:hypothetical protein
LKQTPIGRATSTEEIAVSEDAFFVAGAGLVNDGGWTAT